MEFDTPLHASANSAGSLFSRSMFIIPRYQREYSWGEDEVKDFWDDLSSNLNSQSYFLGLVILTDQNGQKHVVDGQQRIVTLSLLAIALHREAVMIGRKALAGRIQDDFLKSVDYATDASRPRVWLSDHQDNKTYRSILETGIAAKTQLSDKSVSKRLTDSYRLLQSKLREDLSQDPFRRMGRWTEFLSECIYFAVFVHQEPATAYQVFEVINTRGKGLTTADLLKNYLMSQVSESRQDEFYERWQRVVDRFPSTPANVFVQYIRHVVTTQEGYVLPRDLFNLLARRRNYTDRDPQSPWDIIELLESDLPIYMQMMDPSLDGPTDVTTLRVFAALEDLSVITVRPLLLAILQHPDASQGLLEVLKLVVRRIVVGSLGTGNVERRFSEAARQVHRGEGWRNALKGLRDLDPDQELFFEQLRRKTFSKEVLSFIRRSIIQSTIIPEDVGSLHFILPRQTPEWFGVPEEEGLYWSSTIGNTFLTETDRRQVGNYNWEDFKQSMLPSAVKGEWTNVLMRTGVWNAATIEILGRELARKAVAIWFD